MVYPGAISPTMANMLVYQERLRKQQARDAARRSR